MFRLRESADAALEAAIRATMDGDVLSSHGGSRIDRQPMGECSQVDRANSQHVGRYLKLRLDGAGGESNAGARTTSVIHPLGSSPGEQAMGARTRPRP